MQHPKVVIIGAGSLFFGRQALWQMVHSDVLNVGTLAYVDNDPVNLGRMATLAQKVIDHTGVKLNLESSTDAREVLPEADFVIFSFADRSAKFRGIDCKISAKYGVRMCSGDTIGPGGIFRVLREFPNIVKYCRDIEDICPDAWVINYINPTAANGLGIRIFAPNLKSFALCDGLHMPRVKRMYAKRAGIIKEDDEWNDDVAAKFDFLIAGPNHFTWLLKAEYAGEDRIPVIAEALRESAATETDGGDTGSKAKWNSSITYALYKAMGKVPTCVGHTKEYVRFWQGLGVTPEPVEPLSIWDTATRYERHSDMWRQVDAFNNGTTPIEQFMAELGPDHATDIIESMWGKLGKQFFVNTSNNGTLINMPDDAFVEVLSDVSMDGISPRPIGEAPVGLRGLWQQVLDTHELSVRAAMSGDRDLLFQAFICDPMVSSLADSEKIIEELLELERDALPDYWFE